MRWMLAKAVLQSLGVTIEGDINSQALDELLTPEHKAAFARFAQQYAKRPRKCPRVAGREATGRAFQLLQKAQRPGKAARAARSTKPTPWTKPTERAKIHDDLRRLKAQQRAA